MLPGHGTWADTPRTHTGDAEEGPTERAGVEDLAEARAPEGDGMTAGRAAAVAAAEMMMTERVGVEDLA